MIEDQSVKVSNDFASASKESRTSLLGEIKDWLGHNRKWWLLPILVMILLLGALVALASTGLAPFIYPLF